MPSLTRSGWIASLSTVAAGALAIALILRPTRTIAPGPELGTPERLPALAHVALHNRMKRHGEQLGGLVLRAALLDRDGVARIAGEVYDEPRLARPLPGDELEGQLPERFFQLQDELRAGAARLVAAAARGESSAHLADELATFTKTCVACHDAYLHDAPAGAAAGR